MISMCYSAYCPVTYVRKRLGLKLTTAELHACVPHAIAQFLLKIENLSDIIGAAQGAAPLLEMAHAYGLRPRLWLLIV